MIRADIRALAVQACATILTQVSFSCPSDWRIKDFRAYMLEVIQCVQRLSSEAEADVGGSRSEVVRFVTSEGEVLLPLWTNTESQMKFLLWEAAPVLRGATDTNFKTFANWYEAYPELMDL
jgi:hypothetical protein